ncbi:MAG: peptidyl-prolyl cis-trans isomerase, partial [Candidatus Coatesbacteria bacterium]|nr:peptidyl-prolyl cis-trans isomerase [Candidatus Coatesbacteria bacterium]
MCFQNNIITHVIFSCFFLFFLSCGDKQALVNMREDGYDEAFQEVYKQKGGKVIAQVGDKKLTELMLSEFFYVMNRDKVTREEKADFVEQWIMIQILAREARREDLHKRMGNLLFLDLVSNEYLARIYIDQHQKITEKDLKDYFESHKNQFVRKEPIKRFSLIVVANRKKAIEILGMLRKKKITWEKLVSRYGVVEPSRPNKGDIGYVTIEGLKREMGNKGAEAFAIGQGKIHDDYIVAKNQFFFVKCLSEKKAGEAIQYEELSSWQYDKIENAVRLEKMEQLVYKIKKS